ncbi:MAG: DsbA family protein [Methanomicrobiales archaeon]|nr:DsbA family protein [Methanomicrobiales archaeon]
MATKNSPRKKATPPSSPLLGSKGVMAGVIVIAVIISLFAVIYASSNPGASAAIPPQDCGNAVISYLNANLVQANSTAVLVSVAEANGLYKVGALYQARNISVYATKDCSLLFTSSYNMKGGTTPTPTSSPTPTPVPEPVKTSRPSVELFVMSFCPFGTQAEGVMNPVIGLLGTKANITVRYIASVQGTTADSVQSLHGPTEAVEDLRQLCINKYYPQQLWPYLMDYNTNCVPVRQNATSLSACVANTTRKLGINNQKIETCASGSEGLALLEADEAITGSYKVTGSPTLIINGQRYSGARTPDAYKQGICSHFETAPPECSVNLSAQAAGATGSC